MQFGLNLPNTGVCSDPRVLEESGWDGVFVWDALAVDTGSDSGTRLVGDPWIALAAMAMTTQTVKLGPIITPLSRRRPWKVARETVALDLLSNGRLILPVGLGAIEDGGFSKVGEVLDRRQRAEMHIGEGLLQAHRDAARVGLEAQALREPRILQVAEIVLPVRRGAPPGRCLAAQERQERMAVALERHA